MGVLGASVLWVYCVYPLAWYASNDFLKKNLSGLPSAGVT